MRNNSHRLLPLPNTTKMKAVISPNVSVSVGTSLEEEDAGARHRWTISLSIGLLLHAGLLALGVWWPDQTPTASPPSAIMIELAPLPASPPTPPTPSTEIPPGPKQMHAEPVKPALPVEQPSVEKLPLPHVRKAAVTLPKYSTAQPRHAEEDHKRVPQTTAPPAAAAPPAVTAAPVATSTGASMSVPNWQALLLSRLQQFKRYPADAQTRNQQGVVYLRFTMDRKGKVLTFRLEKSSGYTLLDEEALALIQRAQPLPTPPPSVAGDPLELLVPIEFFLKNRR
ncbi:TPA: energy transducer TonB [Raoultella ornithinolytica]